jgi:hypothetical protein
MVKSFMSQELHPVLALHPVLSLSFSSNTLSLFALVARACGS